MFQKKLRSAGLLVFLSFGFLSTVPGFALQSIDTSSGLDQTFTAGYSQRSFAESFHKDFDAPLALEEAWDQWRFYKGINVSGAYDSNIFAAKTNEKDDEFFTYTPTVGVSRKGGQAYFETYYDLSYVDYIENEKLSRFNHSLTSTGGYQWTKLKLDVVNNFRPDTAYAVGERTELRSAEGSRVVTYADNGQARLSYELSPKTSFAYTQAWSIYYFPTGPNTRGVHTLSSQTYTFSPSVSYKLTPKISLNGQYSYATADFYKGGRFDSGSHAFGGGISGRVAPKTNLSFNAGYRFRNYDDASLTDEEDFEMQVAASHRLTSKLLLTAWYSRDLGENFDTVQSAVTNEIKDFVGLNLTWNITPHLALDSQGSVGFTDRPDASPDVENEYYETSVALNWSPKENFAVALGYKFFDKESNLDEFEYKDHKVVTSLKWMF
ncbi:MAG: outer membrane beta-barrel protein [Candidatus Omnitrophica bacterium]|nr:outer membrane beta-barrel protein [Candidatus Omnitrophota bacterium]